ncbi:MAG: hypothetical protein ABEJ98_03630 [Candidatus Nanohaloarchaea archaeon]
MVSEISSGLVVQDSKILMVFDEKSGKWDVPSDSRSSGELSADAAARAVESVTSSDCEVARYRKRLKTVFESSGEERVWQPYTVEISGSPENGEWIPLTDLGSRDLAEPLAAVKDKLMDRL